MLKYTGQVVPFKGKSLLVSAITAGTVPTYALDHIIALNNFKRVGFWNTKHLEPSVGYLPKTIEDGALGLPAQIYVHGDMVILQFRTYVRFGRKKDLAKQLSTFVKEQELGQVIFIASLPYEIKQDKQISSNKKNVYFKLKGKGANSINIQRCMEVGALVDFQALKGDEQEQQVIINCAGISKACLKEFDNILVLMVFNEKEDDKQTGVMFAQELARLIKRKELSNTK